MSETEADQASHHTDYRLKVTAGPSYDLATHQLVPVNDTKTLTFENEHIIISLAVRIKHFTGYPPHSPETSSYFEHALHTSDQYSISFSFIPKEDIVGTDLLFGNDFERPIKDRLPPGFNQAFKYVKSWIDPGLEGDVYADKPYLYGPALSSWNILWIGDQVVPKDEVSKGKADGKDSKQHAWKIPNAESFHEKVVEEGGDEAGLKLRSDQSIPDDAAGRKKFFLNESHRQSFVFEAGRLYQSDFGNPYLDFNDFSLKLTSWFSLNVIKYIDSKTHELRYTLKNKTTGVVYAVVMFNLLFGEELEKEERNWNTSDTDKTNAGKPDAHKLDSTTAKSDANNDNDDEGVD